MTKEEKIDLAREMRANLHVTKEQYIEMCKLCDELDLVRSEGEPGDPTWDEIIEQEETRKH